MTRSIAYLTALACLTPSSALAAPSGFYTVEDCSTSSPTSPGALLCACAAKTAAITNGGSYSSFVRSFTGTNGYVVDAANAETGNSCMDLDLAVSGVGIKARDSFTGHVHAMVDDVSGRSTYIPTGQDSWWEVEFTHHFSTHDTNGNGRKDSVSVSAGNDPFTFVTLGETVSLNDPDFIFVDAPFPSLEFHHLGSFVYEMRDADNGSVKGTVMRTSSQPIGGWINLDPSTGQESVTVFYGDGYSATLHDSAPHQEYDLDDPSFELP